MSLLKQLQEDLVTARKARTDTIKIELLKTTLNRAMAAGKAELREPTDEEVLDAVKYYSKGAKETMELMLTSNMMSDPRFETARQEVAMLAEYLPKQLDDVALLAEIRVLLPTNIGVVMKTLKAKFGDGFDAKRAKELFTKETS